MRTKKSKAKGGGPKERKVSSKVVTRAGTQARLVPTSLAGVFTFEAPPKGFDMMRASADELHSYGFPHRPDPRKFPHASRLWHRVMRRVKRFVTPELTLRPDIVHGPDRNLRRLPRSAGRVFSGSNWSGLVLTGEAPFNQVWGTWMIPAVQVPPGQSGDFFSSTWVGLGGFVEPDFQNLFQAGTAQNTFEAPFAWIQWFPAPSISLGQPPLFPIAPGQTIVVSVGWFFGLPGGPGGVVSMANLETGLGLGPLAFQIPTVDFNGNPITPAITEPPSSSAEWIVERPSTLQNGQLVITELADYGELNFTNAGAVGHVAQGDVDKQETIAAASTQGTQVTMIADDGVTPLSEETVAEALHFTFEQTAAGQ
jgi:hypothetical protein